MAGGAACASPRTRRPASSILSTWKADVCVGTVRLLPDEAAELVAGVAEALSRLASRPAADHPDADVELRLSAVEERLRRLEA